MNNPHPRIQSPAAHRRHVREGGNSLIEVALSLPVLIWMLLGIADFAAVFNTSIELSNAARAGAQYGSRTVATAGNTTGMINAAKQSNLNGNNIDIHHITFDQSEEPCSSIPRSELGQNAKT